MPRERNKKRRRGQRDGLKEHPRALLFAAILSQPQHRRHLVVVHLVVDGALDRTDRSPCRSLFCMQRCVLLLPPPS